MLHLFGTSLNQIQMKCLMLLVELTGDDELEFDYQALSSEGPCTISSILKITDMEEGRAKDFFMQESDLFFNHNSLAATGLYDATPEDEAVIFVNIHRGRYGFLVAGDDGIIAITFEDSDTQTVSIYLRQINNDPEFGVYGSTYWAEMTSPD
jgi:hypothetical protein